MTVLLSIKPEFADKIFDGTKKYEYRRKIFKRQDVDKIIVYASSPVKQIIGEFLIDDILSNDVDTIWNETNISSGISKTYYETYFENTNQAYAIKIGRRTRYKMNKKLSDFNIKTAPQSFTYLKR